MKKHTLILLSIIIIAISMMSSIFMTSCKKKSNNTADSGTFYFHLHTNIADTTIGGNTDGSDSNASSLGASPWNFDTLGRRILLTVPQFFVSNIMLVNANGSVLTLNNVVLLKGLDSEDYYCCKVPVGTYTSAMFTVGLSTSNNALPPTTLFVTDGIPYPVESGMWMGATSMGYYGMKVQGQYDTTAAHSGINPINFSFELPNSLTSTTANQVVLPTRGTGAWTNYPVYVLTNGGTQYVHIFCDYGKLLSVINLKTSYQTDGMTLNPSIADSLANNIPNMFRYEQ